MTGAGVNHFKKTADDDDDYNDDMAVTPLLLWLWRFSHNGDEGVGCSNETATAVVVAAGSLITICFVNKSISRTGTTALINASTNIN